MQFQFRFGIVQQIEAFHDDDIVGRIADIDSMRANPWRKTFDNVEYFCRIAVCTIR